MRYYHRWVFSKINNNDIIKRYHKTIVSMISNHKSLGGTANLLDMSE
jgi:hypothetical protein